MNAFAALLCDLASELALGVKAIAINAAVLADRAELALRHQAAEYEHGQARALASKDYR